MEYQNLELEDILNLDKGESASIRGEIQRVASIAESSIEIGKVSLGAANILRNAGYEYTPGIDDKPFFIEHLFSIILSFISKFNIYTDGNGLITEIEAI